MRRSALLFLILCLGFTPARAEDRSHVETMKTLSINRSLLTKAEGEYRALLKKEQEDPSSIDPKQMEDLRYKIQALKEDAERLQSAMPADMKAGEFMKEMVERQQTLGTPSSPVDIEAEKKLDTKLRELYRLHEKALGYVAVQQYDEAAAVYQEIILSNPDNDEAYLLLGHTLLAGHRYRDASQAFRHAIHINPMNLKEIPRLYENVLVENPSDDEAMTLLGYAHLLLGHEEQARTSFEEALKLNRSNAEAGRGLMELPN